MKNEELLLSIIIPAYNVKDYLPRTLNSLIKQKPKVFEIIVVDDGSTDNSYQIAKEILEKSSCKYKIFKKKNGGVSSARNYGLKLAKGKYVMFLDGDDFVSDNFMEVLLPNLYKQYDVIFWNYDRISEDGRIIKRNPFKSKTASKTLFSSKEALSKILVEGTHRIWTGGICYKNSIIKDKITFNEKATYGEDIEFIIKAISLSEKVLFLNETLSHYLIRNSSITRSQDLSLNLRKLDAIGSSLRLIEHLKARNDEEFEPIIKAIEHEEIPFDFLGYFFIAFAKYFLSGKKNLFFKEFNESYPNLLEEVKPYILKSRFKSKRLPLYLRLILKIESIIFSVSFNLYILYSEIKTIFYVLYVLVLKDENLFNLQINFSKRNKMSKSHEKPPARIAIFIF